MNKILADDHVRSVAFMPDYFKHNLVDLSHEQLMGLVTFIWLSGLTLNDAILTYRAIHGLPALTPRFHSATVQAEPVIIAPTSTEPVNAQTSDSSERECTLLSDPC